MIVGLTEHVAAKVVEQLVQTFIVLQTKLLFHSGLLTHYTIH